MNFLIAVAAVVAIIPVALLVPPSLVLVPPAMVLTPALFADFVQLAPFVIGLSAITAMMLDRFMQFVFGMLDAALASFIDLPA